MKTLRLWLAWIIASWLLVSLSADRASAAGPPDPATPGLFLMTGGRAGMLQAPVLGTAVDLQVRGILARGTVRQVFHNPTRKPVAGIYLFPLPENAAVDGLRVRVADRLIEGRIGETEENVLVFEQAEQQGFVASLLEQERSDVFSMVVSNIGAGDTVEVEIDFQETVAYRQGRFRLRLPLLVGKRFRPAGAPKALDTPLPDAPVLPPGSAPINPVSLRVDLSAGLPLRRLESPTHAVRVLRHPGSHYEVGLAEGMVPADGDFVLEWQPEAGREPRAVVYTQELEGEHYALLMIVPPESVPRELPRQPRETVFVVDTSGSMEGTPLEQAKRALLRALDRLQPGDRFNVIRFSDTAESLFPAGVEADPAAVEKAGEWIRDLSAKGGTQMLPAFQTVLQPVDGWPGLRQVIFATDGQAENQSQVFELLAQRLGTRRLFTIGIGATPNASFLGKAAEIGRGLFTAIPSLDRVESSMDEVLAQIEAPVARDLAAVWDDAAAEVWPERLPDLFAGEPLVIAARLSAPSGSVKVSGLRGDEPWEASVSLAQAIPGVGIDKLWARRKIESLLDRLWRSNDADARAEITRLGLRHGLLTPFTSFVAVDSVPTGEPGEPAERHLVPLNAPRHAVSESIIVNSSIQTGTTMICALGLSDLEEAPGWPDPWMVLPRTPGLLTGRWSSLDGTPPLFAAPGGPPDQSVILLDGLEVSDAASLTAFLVDPALAPVEGVEVAIGGAETSAAAPGARVNLVTPRGTNELRASVHSLWAAPEDELRRHGTSGVELGGPLRRDHLWLRGSWNRQEVRWDGSGGRDGRDDRLLQENGSLRLDSQPLESNSATISWIRGDAARAETPGEHDGRTEIRRLQDAHVFSSSFFLTGSYGEVDREARGDGASAWQADALARDASLEGSLSVSGAGAHELRFGARWREDEDGVAFGSLRAGSRAEARGLWLQDSWTRDRMRLGLGLRYYGQRLPAFGAEAATLSPRLDLSWTLSGGRTELQAVAGRFASRLGPAVAAWLRAGGEWVDPGLSPETTDELLLGLRRGLAAGPAVVVRATYRRTSHLLETETAGGSAPRLVAGDGREDVLGLTLETSGRLDAARTQIRGHLTWLDWSRSQGGGRPRFLDESLALRSRWSYHLGGSRDLPGAFTLSAGLSGREDTLAASDVFTADARLARDFALRGLRLTLSLDGFNLTGEDMEPPSEPVSLLPWAGTDRTLLPRAFRLGVRLGWE